MANSLAISASPIAAPAPTLGTSLGSMAAGQKGRVVSIALEAQVAAWLRAVGLREGAQVAVLRRAPFGGPIHVRTSDGGEFAIHRELAASIQIASVEAPGA